MVGGHKVVTAVSKAIYVATKGGKVGNYKKVKLNKKSEKLKKGKKLKLKATLGYFVVFPKHVGDHCLDDGVVELPTQHFLFAGLS